MMTFGSDEFKLALGHFCTGVALVTGNGPAGPAGFACQSFTSVSLEPPLILICPAQTSKSWPIIRETGYFGVNILSSGQEALSRRFAISGPGKFADAAWLPGTFGSPCIEDCIAFVECRIADELQAGDHSIVLGEVVDLHIDGRAAPLLFYRSSYAALNSSA